MENNSKSIFVNGAKGKVTSCQYHAVRPTPNRHAIPTCVFSSSPPLLVLDGKEDSIGVNAVSGEDEDDDEDEDEADNDNDNDDNDTFFFSNINNHGKQVASCRQDTNADLTIA